MTIHYSCKSFTSSVFYPGNYCVLGVKEGDGGGGGIKGVYFCCAPMFYDCICVIGRKHCQLKNGPKGQVGHCEKNPDGP